MKDNNRKLNIYMYIFILFLVILIVLFLSILLHKKQGTEESYSSSISEESKEENIIIDNYEYEKEKFTQDTSHLDTSNFNLCVSLGDSITYGTSLEDIDTRFTSLIESNLNIKTLNYGIDGMTSEWLLSNLKKGTYQNKIKNADIITLSIGSNDVLIAFYKAIAKAYDLEFYNNNVLEEATELFKDSTLEEKYEMIVKLHKVLTSKAMKKDIDKAYSNYQKNFKYVIKYLKKTNPNAKIIALEYYNPYHSMYLPFLFETTEKLNTYFNDYVDKLNNYLSKNQNLGYEIAYIKDDFYSANACNCKISIFNFSLDPHPNKLGHYIIYNSIIKTLIGR